MQAKSRQKHTLTHTNESMRNADALRRRGSNLRVFHTPCNQLWHIFSLRKAKFSRALRAQHTYPKILQFNTWTSQGGGLTNKAFRASKKKHNR